MFEFTVTDPSTELLEAVDRRGRPQQPSAPQTVTGAAALLMRNLGRRARRRR